MSILQDETANGKYHVNHGIFTEKNRSKTDFIKLNQRIRKHLGCDRTTLIFDRLEFYFKKQPDGFYKFIEPNSHKLYKDGDSWTELLGCHRTSFWRAFKTIGTKHASRWEFEKATDKFEGKLYASYYDRLTNRMFFVRNPEAVEAFLAKVQPQSKSADRSPDHQNQNAPSLSPDSPLPLAVSLNCSSVGGEQNARSYKEAKKTSLELSKDNSHASNEMIKKMIGIWTAIVEEGREQLFEVKKGKLMAFLKKAFTDKFSSCLQNWKDFCIRIARSKFLMGEKTSFKATLGWALKFDSIEKVLSGNWYGIGDRDRKLTPEEIEEQEQIQKSLEQAKELEKQKALQVLEQEIRNAPNEPESIKNFRIKWLRIFGEQSYREFLATSVLKTGSGPTELVILPKERMTAIRLQTHWTPDLLSDQAFKRVQIYHSIPDFNGKPLVFDCWLSDSAQKQEPSQEEKTSGQDTFFPKEANTGTSCQSAQPSAQTQALHDKLKDILSKTNFPHWLERMDVLEIREGEALVVGFDDAFATDYAKTRFFEEIHQAAKDLWNLGKVIFQKRERPALSEPIDLAGPDKEASVLKAIQSLMGEKFQLNDAIPF